MIKVLMVVCNNTLNGTERYVLDLSKNLPKSKFDVTIATPIKGPLSEVISSKGLNEFIYNNGKIEYYSIRGLFNLYKYIKQNKIDIVHANAKFQPCLVSKLAGVEFIVETKHGIFYSAAQLSSLPLWRKFYERYKQYFVDKIIAISENDKNTMIKYFRIKKEKISIIYNGLDFDCLTRTLTLDDNYANVNKKEIIISNVGRLTFQKANDRQEFVIGCIGRLTFQKAQEVLLESFKMLHAKFHNVRLVLVGTGENEKMLMNYIESNQLENKVVFKGYVKNIYKELLNFDLLVLTSRFEGTPYVIFEAMALGVPVVATDVGGVSNILKNEFDAIITEVDNPQSTANAIDKLITDTDFKNRIIANASKTVQKYTVQQMAENTADLYLSNLLTI